MTFFDKYSYKQKNYALLVFIVLLGAAVYKRSLSVTYETKRYDRELDEKLEIADKALMEIGIKKSEIALLDRMIGKENLSVEKVQQGFLNFFAQHSSNIGVYKIEEVLKFQHPDFTINSHQIVLKGGYLNTLDFLYKMEKEFDLARLVNTSFEYKKMNSEESESLYTTLILQNYMR
jgi:hypothetical protein